MAQEQLARMLPEETDDLVSNNFNPNLQFEIEQPGFAPYRVCIPFEWVLLSLLNTSDNFRLSAVGCIIIIIMTIVKYDRAGYSGVETPRSAGRNSAPAECGF